jgi:hypothetical protein
MAGNDICADIATLLIPMPSREDQDPYLDDDTFYDMAQAAWKKRESMAEALRRSWQEAGADPLLSTLTDLRQRRLQLEADMRLLMAYGRRFTHPRPYKLIDLANAAGMSISGVRIAFDDDEINQAAGILERQPAAGDGVPSAGTKAPFPRHPASDT